MNEWIQPGKTIGIIGGGSVARLLALSAKKMGYGIGILDPDPLCSASSIADWHLRAELTNEKAFHDLSIKSDIVIYETEAFHSDYLRMMKRSLPVPQGEDLLAISQDRVLQKAFLESHSINIAPFATIVSKEDIQEAVQSIGYPCVLKANRTDERYRQHTLLYEDKDIEKTDGLLRSGASVLEAWIPFERELCVAVVKDSTGNILTYPVSEMMYRQDKFFQSIIPARVDKDIQQEVTRIAETVARNIEFQGVIALELLLTSTGSLYVNEIVGHPHQAYHQSTDWTALSQYDAHIRAVCGWTLPESINNPNSTVMRLFNQSQLEEAYTQARIQQDWKFAFYQGDPEDLFTEKGHMTIQTDNVNHTLTLLSDIGM
ncbi:ATP-grasp domain-containing protein [Marinilactibacillus kalidii]|uniref:ATP-grasp domain-containing protein n=1 Tax=Marinilactibacillus kalidii TaxID=2820274 RepID=UPI001ABEE42B|nr:ATP-grasp domain-containing protein [Marinilactibacillus kalidii]